MRRLFIALAAVAALGATAAIAVAVTGNMETTACYDTKTGIVRLDVDGAGCKGKEAPFTFGTTTRLVTVESEPVPDGNYMDAFAACAADEVVLSGGYEMPTINVLVQPFQDMPAELDGQQGWYVVVMNEGGLELESFTAFAVCAPGNATGY